MLKVKTGGRTISKINDIMTNWLGANWKTTVNGVSSELLGLGATVGMLTAIFGTDQHKAIGAIVVVVAAALKAIARTLAWLAAADAVVDTALDPKGDQKAGYSMPMTTGAIALVCIFGAVAMLLSACATPPMLSSAKPDGKVMGVVPVEAFAPAVDYANKDAGNWVRQYGEGMKFLAAVPPGHPVHYGIRLRGTKDQWLDLSQYEQLWWMDPVVSSLTLTAPALGNRVTLQPVLPVQGPVESPSGGGGPVPPVSTGSSPGTTGGSSSDPLDGEINSTITVSP